jgi:hypothetical protein
MTGICTKNPPSSAPTPHKTVVSDQRCLSTVTDTPIFIPLVIQTINFPLTLQISSPAELKSRNPMDLGPYLARICGSQPPVGNVTICYQVSQTVRHSPLGERSPTNQGGVGVPLSLFSTMERWLSVDPSHTDQSSVLTDLSTPVTQTYQKDALSVPHLDRYESCPHCHPRSPPVIAHSVLRPSRLSPVRNPNP